MVILWICVLLACAVALDRSEVSHAEIEREFYQPEYRRCYPVNN